MNRFALRAQEFPSIKSSICELIGIKLMYAGPAVAGPIFPWGCEVGCVIRADFSRPINPGTVNEATFKLLTLEGGTEQPVPGTLDTTFTATGSYSLFEGG